MSNQSDMVFATQKLHMQLGVLQVAIDAINKRAPEIQPTRAMEADCTVEQAAYQAAIDVSNIAYAALSAAQQVADAAAVAAQVACSIYQECLQS